MVLTSASDAMTTEAARGFGDLVYLSVSSMDLAVAADDVRGRVVVDPDGHRLGEIADLVVDAHDRRVRLLSVESGGILGLATTEHLIPVEIVTKVDERVRIDRSCAAVPAVPSPGDRPLVHDEDHADGGLADLYRRYGVPVFWHDDRHPSYFHHR